MTLRPYRDADLAAVASLFTASIHTLAAAHYDAAQRAAWAPQPPDLDEWQRRLAPLNNVVADEGGALAGFCSWEDDGHIEMLFVSPDHARRGVAAAVFGHALTVLADAGVHVLYTEASLVARPFFEQQGFGVEEEQRVERRGVVFRRFAMRKPAAAGGPR